MEKVFLSSMVAKKEGKNLGSISSTLGPRIALQNWSFNYAYSCSYLHQYSWNPPFKNLYFNILSFSFGTMELWVVTITGMAGMEGTNIMSVS